MFTVNIKQRGFTLIELLVTLAVLAIVATIAVPSFQKLLASNNVSFDRDELYSFLMLARSEAIKNGQAVTICKSANGAACDASLSWSAGWLMFADENRDGALAAGEKVLREVSAVDGGVEVSHSSNADVVTFDSRGLLLAGSGNFTFSHPSDVTITSSVALTVTGRATKGG